MLATLANAGGSMDRSKLREAVNPGLKAAMLDQAIARLMAARRIRAEVVERRDQGYSGWVHSRATVYSLVTKRKRC